MRAPVTLLAILLGAAPPVACDDADDNADDGWTEESCREHCEAYYADDLEDSPISAVGFQVDGADCVCTFLPCETSMCTQWCVDNEGIDEGFCQFLECVCVE